MENQEALTAERTLRSVPLQMPAPRFCKSYMVQYIEARMDQLEREHGFRHGDGWGQHEHRGSEALFCFGQYDELRSMLEDFI